MLRNITLSVIKPNPRQPRKHFEGLEELAQSLKQQGQLTPVLVRPVGDGYELVHGERRWRAAQLAGLPTLRAEVRELSDAEAYRLSVVENLQRQQLTLIEEAEVYQTLLADGMTQAELGALVGKSQSYIAHKLRLLKAPAALRALLARGGLSENHARQLLKLEGMYLPNKTAPCLCKLKTLLDEAGSDAKTLAPVYYLLRPEDQPQVLWQLPKLLGDSAHLHSLRASLEALLADCGASGHAIPAWVVSAWWWGSACVVFDLPVAALAHCITTWHERLYSHVRYMLLGSSGPSIGCADESLFWWGVNSDLKQGHCLPVTEDDLDFVLERDKSWLLVPGWTFPSALQVWGSQHDAAARILRKEGERR
jgi:ParB/RepB/Spo0J family partition protein